MIPTHVTVRPAVRSDGDGCWHIECRFANGEKYAPVIVDGEHEDLADLIARLLTDNTPHKCTECEREREMAARGCWVVGLHHSCIEGRSHPERAIHDALMAAESAVAALRAACMVRAIKDRERQGATAPDGEQG